MDASEFSFSPVATMLYLWLLVMQPLNSLLYKAIFIIITVKRPLKAESRFNSESLLLAGVAPSVCPCVAIVIM